MAFDYNQVWNAANELTAEYSWFPVPGFGWMSGNVSEFDLNKELIPIRKERGMIIGAATAQCGAAGGASALTQMLGMEVTMEWYFTTEPTEPGWYAVLICYDPQEGIFPNAGYWDGAKWDRKGVSGHGSKCESKEAAKALAYENDLDA